MQDWKDVTPVPVSYNKRDLLTYAIGIGSTDLNFVNENDENFAMFPTYPIVLGFKGDEQDVVTFPSPAMMASNVMPALDGARAFLDGERYFEQLRPLPSEGGNFLSKTRLCGVFKKGSGAAVESESIISDAKGNDYIKMYSAAFAVGATNVTDTGISHSESVKVPARAPDQVVEMPTLPNQAHLYRLSGDYNPLHIDPNMSQMMGFPQPILHGLCSMGFTARAVLQTYADNDPSKFKAIRVRFAKPVMPGETLVVKMWKEGARVICEVRVKERDVVVIKNCYVDLQGGCIRSKM
jgi:3-hydroxyacyl-CoA dehydrogenase/3a,7a,12a-trihydroxy-5b-cholest-24-enoyl-CoA hydratase